MTTRVPKPPVEPLGLPVQLAGSLHSVICATTFCDVDDNRLNDAAHPDKSKDRAVSVAPGEPNPTIPVIAEPVASTEPPSITQVAPLAPSDIRCATLPNLNLQFTKSTSTPPTPRLITEELLVLFSCIVQVSKTAPVVTAVGVKLDV